MKTKSLRWTLARAAAEFGVTRETIRRGLARDGAKPATDYSTREIFRAIGGDFRFESTRRQRAEADRIERENRLADGEIITVEEALAIYTGKVAALVQNLDALPSLVPGITLEQRQILVTHIEAAKKLAREK